MPTPNRLDIVQQVDRERPELLQANTVASCTLFRQLVAARLHALDPGWGELTKQPGQNQGPDKRAIDALIFKPTQQVVDIVKGAGDGPTPGRPVWIEQPKRSGNEWAVPGLAGQPVPPPDPPPDPKPPVASDDLAQALAHLAAARGEIASLKDALAALERQHDARIATLETQLVERVAALESAEYQVDVATSRALGHAHTVTGSVTRVR